MRIIHTSDWHLGRGFHRVDLLSAQAAYLDHLVEVVRAEKVDAVVVAGDVYDRALPSVDVVSLLDDALFRLVGAGARVILSSGNHDSPRRLGFSARLLEQGGVHIRTDPARVGEPVLLHDAHGPVTVYPIPYLEPAMAAGVLGVEASRGARGHEAVLSAAMGRIRADLAARRPGTRSVVASHAFVVGGAASDSERELAAGGVAAVPVSTFDGVDYVALGHLHGRQRLAPQVRYSGSPLAYSFSEADHRKGSWLVELGAGGLERVLEVDAPATRGLARLTGTLQSLLHDPRWESAQDAWCQVTLTDATRPREAMQQIRGRFPHTVELRFEPAATPSQASSYTARVAGRDDVDVCCGFLEHVRHRSPAPEELALLREALDAARLTDVESPLPVGERGALPAGEREAADRAIVELPRPARARVERA